VLYLGSYLELGNGRHELPTTGLLETPKAGSVGVEGATIMTRCLRDGTHGIMDTRDIEPVY
jgi:hypothetical protein